MRVLVCGRTEAGQILVSKRQQIDAVVSIITPRTSIRARHGDPLILAPCLGFNEFSGPKLVLQFDDVEDHKDPGQAIPQEEDLKSLFSWAQSFPIKDATVLVHCTQGIGRSTAVAAALYALVGGSGSEEAGMSRVLRDRPYAWPNLLVLKLADRLLNRNGALYLPWWEFKEKARGTLYRGALD